jgi:adenosine deaminase
VSKSAGEFTVKTQMPQSTSLPRMHAEKPRSVADSATASFGGTRLQPCRKIAARISALAAEVLFRDRKMVGSLAVACVCVFSFVAQTSAQPAAAPARSASSGEQRAARYLDSIRGNPELLEVFLREMPKGADLHNHLSGAIYAESYIQWAAGDGLCVERATLALAPANLPCDAKAGRPPASDALRDPILYRELVDAFSMRHFSGALQSGHDHFFDTFPKFGAVSRNHTAQMMAEAVSRAASQHVEYMELILNLDGGKATDIGKTLTWDDNFDNMRQKVDAAGAAGIVAAARQNLDNYEAEMKKLLRCDQPPETKEEHERRERQGGAPRGPDAGCQTTVRYIYEVYRANPREQVFAQTQVGFELAAADPRVVSVNPVQPEDWFVPIRDYDLHMRIFSFLKQHYPKVRITMHAGELAPGLVPPRRLHDHIRDAIEKGGAERIGHGVDIMQEDDPFELLKTLRQRKIMVEINLTSNDVILGVTGMRHPFPIYLKWGVPVALSTDDEGVSRGDITHEYLRATQDYNLTYAQLKKISRTGIEYGFEDAATKKQLLGKFDNDFADFERDCCNNKP